ncbi:NAD(P)-dependent alcohol dehydrogenase [Streptomyces sp. NBC_00201]|uniref:NAD(P)-dependent alcohol dehydrogenase n=1 Tax=unclassified Streptomyces TaxID=2593676 RepID=UPI002250B102|nr:MULTISPECIES: NAD(P)-dependent alcohol dehydrogenase [unclassified Streptomyces]MCX5063216.1 NAD(P)-dependent alcohol dehydrogenase [Streptomyces sp. NBC_00452]MCX5251056.1 NAD(P)-dependent alcohol dehydrogenase [Streptomyces sp. NBC_00201]MCX5291015.1 NAD(P)-dependent alcohol dehydrogenase [Streptomyces sp. NBC_00183]
MRAVRLREWGREPTIGDVQRPEPRGAEVLVRVEAVGLCHSDLHVIDSAPGTLPYRLPFTLGHEVAGHIAALGLDAEGLRIGERVAIYGPWGCGDCSRCTAGRDNYCDRRGELGRHGVGLGQDGGMAEYVLVPSARHLVPIGDLPSDQAAPLSDAGLTSYHAVAGLRGALGEASTAVVIGVGGLGHLAVQILRATTPSRVLAVDVREEALAVAHRSGAHDGTLMRADTARVLRAATAGVGADAVLDFVGNDATLRLAVDLLRPGGELALVGSGGGQVAVRKPGFLPPGFRLSLPFWGTRPELAEVIALARSGALHVEIERLPLSAALEAFGRLRRGRVRGRAVLVPD